MSSNGKDGELFPIVYALQEDLFMVSFKVVDVKGFMSSLLVHNTFDNFFLSEFEITTFNQFHISGKLVTEYYSSEELELLGGRRYSTWSEIKPVAYSLVKGQKQPLFIKIVFRLSDANVDKIRTRSGITLDKEEIDGLFLNVRYEKGILHLVTGTSIRTFTMDKTIEQLWDENVKSFLKRQEIPVEVL